MPMRYQPALDLARMRPKNFAEALRLLLGDNCEDRGEKLRAKRQLVQMIWSIESDFTDPEKPPRVSEVRRMLRESREAAEKLRRVILPLSARLWDRLQLILPSPLVDPELHESLRSSKFLIADADPDLNTSGLYEALIALEKFCYLLDEKLLPEDRGGHTHILTGKRGNPKARLVTEAGRLFSDWHPERITGTEGGPFYDFCAALYELITGNQPEGPGGGLKRYVEFVAPRIRQLEGLHQRWMRCQLTSSTKTPRTHDVQEANRLWHEMVVLHDELAAGPSGRARL